MKSLTNPLVTSAFLALLAAACDVQSPDVVSETSAPLTAPVAGAVAKPSTFTIVPPWASNVSHTLWQTYGTNLHRNTNSTGSSNDYYALDLNLALNEAVYPIADGTVVYAGPALGGWAGYGNIVFLNHVVGGVNYQSLYAHLSSVAVSSGTVTTSTMIGRAGNSGTTSVHLHLAVYKQASFYNTATARGPYGGNAVVPEAFSQCTKSGGSCENLAVGNVLAKSASTSPPLCGSGLYCAANSIPGSSLCLSGTQSIYCCPLGQTIVNGACSSPTPPPCGFGLYCAANSIPGSSQCLSGTQTVFCCAPGHTIINGACSP